VAAVVSGGPGAAAAVSRALSAFAPRVLDLAVRGGYEAGLVVPEAARGG
jgi:hypothetical protein